ncbi:hypothetical protein K443DRAFT_91526, partial [Laccaria amethystina LaAM-08-1]
PPPMTVRTIEPIIETDMETEVTHRLGMEDGFDRSPMARLIKEYSGEAGEADNLDAAGIPTRTNVNLVLGDNDLTTHMIVDRGPDADQRLPRYHLTALHLDRITTVVTEQQIFLERAAGLITERTTCFKIDPGDTLLPLLRGASSVAQLRAAWLALRHRVELGTKAWQKYTTEYQLPVDSKPTLSPLSTLPELYPPLQDIAGSDDKLRYLYSQVPHHKEQLTQEGKDSLERARSWLDVLPMPEVLKNAFTESKQEHRPTKETKAVRKGAKGKEKERQGSSRTVVQTATVQPTVWMGTETPFKSANNWFVDQGRSNRARQPGTSRPQTEPNILLGIATPQQPSSVRVWEGREQPPHIPTQPQNSGEGNQSQRGESRTPPAADDRQPQHRSRRGGSSSPSEPSSSDDESSSFRSRRSHPSRGRRRRSRTPRPRRRRSPTPRPHRRRSSPDDDGGDESGGNSSNTTYSSSSSTRSGSRRSRQRSEDSVVIPYGRIAPTIDSKLKQEDLPTWDGNPNTAIEYFWKVQQQASLGGYIPSALGYWLWLKLKEGSDVQTWFATLPSDEQARMRGHWVDYLKGIKEGYLGRNWQFDIGEVYKAQYFRQPGHERELPKAFITRRIMYTRMLAKSDDGGPLEVHLVMARAPLAWRTILILENIKSSSRLYAKAVEHETALLEISRSHSQATNVITSENLVPTLRKMGYALDRSKFHNFPQNRRVNLAANEEETSSAVTDPKETYSAQSAIHESLAKDAEILTEVFQVLKKRQRPPPPGGYMFSKNDHVTTKMGRLPPSPCKCCGSNNHWDKECPDWAVYLEKTAKSGYSNETELGEDDEYYQSAYSILLSQRVASLQVDHTKLEKDFKSAVCNSTSNQSYHRRKAEKSPARATVSIEEVEDEHWEEHRKRPKSHAHILEAANEKLKGYVRIPIFMQTADGVLLETEAEAYVVPRMTVPILLGEDYQLNYELGVTRNVETGTKIRFAGSDHEITATRVDRTADFDRMRQSTMLVNKFVKAKVHRREKARRHRRKLKFGIEERTVRATEDCIVKPHACHRIRVEGQLDEDKDWLVEKSLLANANDSYFAAPNTLVSARNPWVPVANPTDQPRFIRKGEVIGSLHDPAEFFETPNSAERADIFKKHAASISAIINTQLGESNSSSDTVPTSPSQQVPEEEEEYGPKTAAMPDLTDYPSARMEELIDVGTLPDHLKDQAWDMLRKRQKAFGFDGRLGHLPTKVHIRTVDGQVPIAVPMYGSSPEKRRRASSDCVPQREAKILRRLQEVKRGHNSRRISNPTAVGDPLFPVRRSSFVLVRRPIRFHTVRTTRRGH